MPSDAPGDAPGETQREAQRDAQWMERACRIALQGQGRVEPNPMVGCVIVRGGQAIAEGFHAQFGGPHAERAALANLRGASARGATVYVTLEPCCHHGKTPPCTDALIEAGVARVCCAVLDPFPQVSGRGVEQLRSAGIHVDVGCAESTARSVLAPYLKRVTQQRPFVIAKWAMSLDGKIATHTGDSRWISSAASRAHAHQIRGTVDAIIVGSRTAQIDDPLLTARPAGPRTPLRVVIDSRAGLSPESQLARTARESPVLVWAGPAAPAANIERLRQLGCQVHICSEESHRIDALLDMLAQQTNATNVLCEGGGELLGHLFDLQVIDEVQVYIAPKLIGGRSAPAPLSAQGVELVSSGPTLTVCEQAFFDGDTYIRARMDHATQAAPCPPWLVSGKAPSPPAPPSPKRGEGESH